MKQDYLFICKKCGHNLYVDKASKIKTLDEYDCPSCGEEGYENWIFSGMGVLGESKL